MDIRRFFVSSKPAAQKPSQDGNLNTESPKKKSVSTDEEVKKKQTATKVVKKKKKDSDKKTKKRAVIESDSEEEVVKQKVRKQHPPLPPAKKDPVQYVSETDSDSDNFLSLKKSAKPQDNGVTKPGKARTGTKEIYRSPSKPTPAPAKGKGVIKKSPPAPVTPKSAPQHTKRTPTSVLDYFGSGSVQRSGKKLVASTKRKADHDESLTDEVIAQQLQMDEDMELERLVHEDEEFARTLAMLDQEPHAKKARKDSGKDLGSDTSANKSIANSSHSSTTSQSQSNGRDHNQDVIGPSPKKVPPLVKTSSKLAVMKRREVEEEGGGKTNLTIKMPVSPKKEFLTTSSTDRKSKPKTGSVTMVTTRTTLKTSPKKESTSPEDSEKKRGNSSAFRSFLNRDGPRALGSKPIPTGAENCLEGCVFVISGVLESMEREDAKSLIERYGGKVTGNVSKRTTYLVMGRDGGAAKTDKAEGFGTKILDEDGLLELIRCSPGKKSKYLIAAEAEVRGTMGSGLKVSPHLVCVCVCVCAQDMKLGPFDVCRKVFSKGEESGHMTLIDKSDLFFHDYALAPLFIQENYIHVRPAAAGGDLKSHLVLLSKTADCICDGDLVDRQIRSKQAWSLLPTQAIYSSVLPGELMRGYMNSFPSFPSWLGKFSSCNKHSRIIQELASHMSLKTLSSRQAVSLDYLPYLRMSLLCPLQRRGAEGAGQAVQLLDDYHLVREDVDSLMEISLWGGQPDPYAQLDPKVKSAFTRAYNRETHLTPYSLQPIKKGRRGGVEAELGGEEQAEQPEEEEEEEGVAADAMIKKKAKPSKEPKKEKTTAGDSGKGKGKGKGRK
ncbi:LOW QUALITY PROTEIN: replication factor C subunit 1 [Salmo salar]|uniref:Replication factor C subunit 1 n=1 Tax=Salmo salar TaxID=8030 RepID=A0ABM3EFV5_SALSA|nr:LOW QUALITY PROTEIN: replication factor C subunit 1 [Salmo salar]